MTTTAGTAETTTGAEVAPLHILWMNGGLGCDGDSVALTGATQPSIEEIVLGALPGLPKIAVHWPLIDFECGPEQGADSFIEWWHKADRGELEPFVLVVEGSIPNESIKEEGYWAGFGTDPMTGQPIKTSEWLDRLARKATAIVERWAPGGSSMNGMNLSGKPGIVQPMQIPPTLGQPPTPLIQPRFGTLHITTGPQQPSLTMQVGCP